MILVPQVRLHYLTYLEKSPFNESVIDLSRLRANYIKVTRIVTYLAVDIMTLYWVQVPMFVMQLIGTLSFFFISG